jgi:hypothetical protein
VTNLELADRLNEIGLENKGKKLVKREEKLRKFTNGLTKGTARA